MQEGLPGYTCRSPALSSWRGSNPHHHQSKYYLVVYGGLLPVSFWGFGIRLEQAVITDHLDHLTSPAPTCPFERNNWPSSR